jgi:hypothetical protein
VVHREIHLRAPLRAALALSIVLSAASAAGQAPQAPKPAERVRFAPRYHAGQTLHYQIDFRTETTSHTAGAVENPQGASQIDLNVSLLLRLDVLSTLPAIAADLAGAPVSPGARSLADEGKPWRARLRATYEKSSVTVRGDSYDPAAGDLEAQYRELAGHAVEFTLESDGTVSELTGLAEVLRDDRSRIALRGWLAQLTAGMDFPRQGIALGWMWSKEKHIEESPLAGTILDTHSTYVRNERCRANVEADTVPDRTVAPPPPASGEMCAVVVTRYEMKQQGKPRRPGQDATPEALRRRGLRSSGTWTSSGESLAYISLTTGLTVSVTQSGAEEMNMTVGRPSGGLPFHYSAQIRTETHLTLLPAATPGSTSSVP